MNKTSLVSFHTIQACFYISKKFILLRTMHAAVN